MVDGCAGAAGGGRDQPDGGCGVRGAVKAAGQALALAGWGCGGAAAVRPANSPREAVCATTVCVCTVS